MVFSILYNGPPLPPQKKGRKGLPRGKKGRKRGALRPRMAKSSSSSSGLLDSDDLHSDRRSISSVDSLTRFGPSPLPSAAVSTATKYSFTTPSFCTETRHLRLSPQYHHLLDFVTVSLGLSSFNTPTSATVHWYGWLLVQPCKLYRATLWYNLDRINK